MKELQNAELMRLTANHREPQLRLKDKDGWPLPETEPGATYACNVEPRAAGTLECARSPVAIARTQGSPLLADKTDAVTFIYTIDSHNSLSRLEQPVSMEDSKTVEYICSFPRGCAQLERCGDFLIARLTDGTLYYLHAPAGSSQISPLGSIPSAPKVKLKVTNRRLLTTYIPRTTFSTPVEDPRAGLPPEAEEKVREAGDKGALTLMQKAAGMSLWCGPVCVRVAVRLVDGSLLSVTDPMLVGTDFSIFRDGLNIPLAHTSKGYTGTGQVQMTAEAFGLQVEVGNMPPAKWSGLIRALEIWVTPQPLDAVSFLTSTVGYFQLNSQDMVRLSAPSVASTKASSLALAGQLLISTVPPQDGTFDLMRDERAAEGNPRLETVAHENLKAAVMTTHDAFLHLADIRRPLPDPTLPTALDDAGKALCIVTVDVRSDGGIYSVRTIGEVASARLAPLLWYPSSKAETMRVALREADGTMREQTFALKAAPDGSDCAFYDAEAEELDTMPTVSSFDTSLLGENFERVAGNVITMRRGNPMVAVSETQACDATITALAAQPVGGGAYTRQYLYAFSDHGIVALMHNARGEHMNARGIGLAVGIYPESLARTPEGVFAITPAGELLQMRDARVATHLRGLTEYSRLAWHRARNQLWLLPFEPGKGKSLVLEMNDGIGKRLGALRSIVPSTPITDDGSFLFAIIAGSHWVIYRFADGTSPDSYRMTSTWVSPAVEYPDGYVGQLDIDIQVEAGEQVTLTVEGLEPWLAPPSMTIANPLIEATLPQAGRRLTVPFLLPGRLDMEASGYCRFTLAGRWSSLGRWSLTPLPRAKATRNATTIPFC